MVVIAPSRQEGRAVPEPLLDREAQHTGVEIDRALKVGDLQVDMADPGFGMRSECHRWFLSPANKVCALGVIKQQERGGQVQK
jgi:hypothetical protein